MRIGLALPQYDYSVPGESPLTFPTLAEHARRAEAAGDDSLWGSDPLFLDLRQDGATDGARGAVAHLSFRVRGKTGAPDAPRGVSEPIATLGALAGVVSRPRLGTLVLCEAL